jgi:tRNA 2-thiouridine synthesizing protein A
MSRTWFGRVSPGGRPPKPPPRTGDSASPVPPRPGPRDAPAATVADLPTAQPVLTIDALGRKCPIPIIMLAEQIRDVPVGEVIAVLADDPAAYTDVPAWCGMKSHEFVFREELESGWSFGIRRRY